MDESRNSFFHEVTTKPRLGTDPRAYLAKASRSGFQLGSLGRTIDVWKRMLLDPDCVVYLGVAGAVVPAGLGPLMGDLVRANMVDVVYSTGAQVYHDVFEGFRGDHYKLTKRANDTELGRMNIDRIYDVIADDLEYQKFDEFVAERIKKIPPSDRYTTPLLVKALVETLGPQRRHGDGLVISAVEKEVPVFVPTFFDSSVAFPLALLRHREGRSPVNVDFVEDLIQQVEIFKGAKVSGAVFLGGGVPKNHIQQLHPLRQVIEGVLGHQDEGHGYGVQFTADNPVWGGLSGCTMEESESWGKYTPDSPRAVCYGDATINFTLAASTVHHELGDALAKREPRRLMRVVEAKGK